MTSQKSFYLVLLETSGNQQFIFSTNRLRENIGASELTYQAGTKWVIEAVDAVRGASDQIHQVGTQFVMEALNEINLTTQEIREKILDTQEWNRPIENQTQDHKVEVLIATSGKALLLTEKKDVAQAIIRYVTHKAIRYAPGLDIAGVISEPFSWDDIGSKKAPSIAAANKEVHQKFEELRSRRPSPLLRFLQLPVVDQCSTSGLPASELEVMSQEQVRNHEKPKAISQVAKLKREAAPQSLERIQKLLPSHIKLPGSVNELEKKLKDELDWLAIIHADGNGLGEVFLKFHENAQTTNNRDYIDKYRNFSIALDICTEAAFLQALDTFVSVKRNNKSETLLIPLIPLVLGGDDLTVICDGHYALKFTHKFLQEFENQTQQEIQELKKHKSIISDVANFTFTVKRLSSCAGICIIKPHLPFSIAYTLAERLLKSAKKVKEVVTNSQKQNQPYPCSSIDFHVLYDSSDINLEIIRKKIQLDSGKTHLYRRPYVVTAIDKLKHPNISGCEWAEFHHWQNLETAIKALKATNDDGKPKLPSSQMHDLRSGLFLGRDAADARYGLIRDRYIDKSNSSDDDIRVFEGNPESLFKQEPETETELHKTILLDAIEVAEFFKSKEDNNG
ncbi:hypothetical protein K4A83_22110 [Spirulina subsalsa FACHB-351]|uniref:Cas10/Cmr2 second palm domain-containing protein n=1 Tax=Spirulina subsalsa FACHB-351 TaxID=234711 RepID=A0ABT3LBQ1_9CYAN|nr:hypothetical protein [Spirulina subsalsa]MCW6038925.1 hypothetical protein [Spirulina subsalsa FACHB-351]